MQFFTVLNRTFSSWDWGFIHEVPNGRRAMEGSDKIKGVLDGSIDPQEISGDKKLYSMAERIYGRGCFGRDGG